MGDSTSARIFGKQFKQLAKKPITPDRKKMAASLWKDTREHDFCQDEMECDEALVALGLAKKVKDEYGEPAMWYKGEERP